MTNAIRIEDLSVNFEAKTLFEGLCFTIGTGEKMTLAGASGSGKSTLLRCIMGFIPADTGHIYILNELLTAQSIWQLRGQLAYVAQEPELGDGTVQDALVRPFSYRINRHLSFSQGETLRLFEIFLLPAPLMEKQISALSGGEKQRVTLVIALSLKRPVLLLDEAASALDNASKQAVRDYLCGRDDLTILSVSHDIREFSLSGAVVNMTEVQQEMRP